MKMTQVGADLFHAGGQRERRRDRQTDGQDEAINRFSQTVESVERKERMSKRQDGG
jgi:hypothetical protein